ncbi:hypothetical protein Tco_0335153 [Tanacetum coccineum]
MFEDEMMTFADTLMAIRSTRPRTTSVVICDVEEEPRRATPAQIQRDAEIAQRLHEEEKAELERKQRERAVQEEASNAALIAEFDNVQARMEADALLAARLQEKERDQFSIDEQARFLVETIAERKRFFEQKWIKGFIPMDSEEGGKKAASSKKRPRAEPDEEIVKRQKIGETSGSGEEQSAEKEKELLEEELQKLLVAVLVEKVYVEALQKFNRDYLVKLWDLVKKRFSTTKPTDDNEKELWVELKRLFEPDNEDILWKLQRYMHDPLGRIVGNKGFSSFYCWLKKLLLVKIRENSLTVEVLQTLEYRGGQLNAATVHVPYHWKPETYWTPKEIKAANFDQRLKSLIMSMLLDDQMNSFINCITAKSTWDDLILYYEGPFDVKEINNGIKLSKLEINIGFINGLPKKWLAFYQSLRNTNHVKEFELASLFGKLKYEENLINSIYDTNKVKTLVPATPLSTAFFFSSIVQDSQDSPDDEEDTRSSQEYMNDLEEEYQARSFSQI